MRSTESNFFIGKPGFIRWFFLWDILLLQISFEVQKFLYLSYSWTCKCFRHWKCLCSKFWAFFASLPQHCRSNALFDFFHDPAADFMTTNLDDFVLSNSYLRTSKFLLKSDMQNANRTKRINSWITQLCCHTIIEIFPNLNCKQFNTHCKRT